MSPATNKQCRRCSECPGQEHHWIENDDFEDEGDPEFACKHCDAMCHAKDDLDIGDDPARIDAGFFEPSGIVIEDATEQDDG